MSFPLTSFASGNLEGNSLAKNALESFFLSVLFSSGYIALAMLSGWQFRLSSFGFLDTFDLFDSSQAALPGKLPPIAVT
jgi:hypothetical protein